MPDQLVLLAQNTDSRDRLVASANAARPDLTDASGGRKVWMPIDRPDLTFEDQFRSALDTLIGAADAIDDNPCGHRFIVFADEVNFRDLNAASETGRWSVLESWNTLIAMLILTLPEAYWIFHSPTGDAPADILAAHGPLALRNTRCPEPLLDPSGLRSLVREVTNKQIVKLGLSSIPVRSCRAASIDEETSFAYFHAYTAYRFGCRADVITDWREMTRRFPFKDNLPATLEPHPYWLLLEDMNLNFSDRPAVGQLAKLGAAKSLTGRAEAFPTLDSTNDALETSTLRVLITSGRTGADRELVDRNREWLNRKAHGRGRVLFKPARGMFDLWRRAAKVHWWQKSLDYAPGFTWPPPESAEQRERRHHGSVGKLQLLSEILVARAERALTGDVNLLKALRAAVWSTDALEFTCLLTPTLSTHALNLKHRAELIVECQFSGIEHHIDVERRLHEIKRDTTVIASRVDESRFNVARSNAELRVLNGVVLIMRDNNLFDEEQHCMTRARQLHNRIWFAQHKWALPAWLVFAYIQWLLRSPLRLLMMIAFWLFVLTIAFTVAGGHPTFWHGASAAVTSFFSVGAPIHPAGYDPDTIESCAYVAFINASIVLGFLHLGVFIAHLYTLTMRR